MHMCMSLCGCHINNTKCQALSIFSNLAAESNTNDNTSIP